MRRLCLAALMLLIAIPAVVAQDAEPKPETDPSIKLMELYAKSGRNWAYRVVSWTRGESPNVETNSFRVTSVKNDTARISEETESADGSSFSSSTYGRYLKKPTPEELGWAASDLPGETLDMGFGKFECRKQVKKSEGSQVTTWVSTRYHPLIVKQVSIESNRTVIRKLNWFDAADVDPYQLYRKQGRSWSIRTVTRAGGARSESTMQYTVKEVDENGATFTLSMVDGQGTSMFSQDQEISFETTSMAVGGGRSSDAEMVTKTCEAGEFLCMHTNEGGFESWASVQWPGLSVASKMQAFEMELISFDLGHDPDLLFGKTGNFYTTRETSIIAGKEVAGNTTHVEVTEVSETEAKYSVTVTNAEGKQVSSETLTHKFVVEDEEESAGYAGEIEQMVETAAGTYPALYTVAEDGTESWSWNGIVILAKSQGPDTEGAGPHTIELTELKME